MTSHHSRHVLPCSLVAGFLLAAAVASAQAPGANANQPDTPGTGRFPAMKEEVVSLPSHVAVEQTFDGADPHAARDP